MIKGALVHTLDGNVIEVKVNFGTLYYLSECGGDKLIEKIEKKQNDGQKITSMEQFKVASRLIYALLRSNGVKTDIDGAMAIVPPDTDEIEKLLISYKEQLEKYKKKEASKKMTMVKSK